MCSFLVLVIFALMVSVTLAYPQRCGVGYSCISGRSTCDGTKCVCNSPFTHGDPSFNCYDDDTVAAEIKNDPVLITFNKEKVHFPFLCRYLFTHVRTELRAENNSVIGNCEILVHGTNAKAYGKIHVHSFDVAAKITYNSGGVVGRSNVITGSSWNRTKNIAKSGAGNVFSPNGPWHYSPDLYSDFTNQVHVEMYEEYGNSRLVYVMDSCGFKATFTPYDHHMRREQVTQPGLSVAIDKTHNPAWLSNDKVVGLAPVSHGGLRLKDLELTGVTKTEAMFYHTIRSYIPQMQPIDNMYQCEDLNYIFTRCNRTNFARGLRRCSWMFKEPRFLKCYDNSLNSAKAIHLFNRCLNIFCGTEKCRDIKQDIIDNGCSDLRDMPTLKTFVFDSNCQHKLGESRL